MKAFRIKSEDMPDDAPKVRDPHHELDVEWALFRNGFWHRHSGQSKWTKVKKIHPTPRRIAALASLGVPTY